MEFKFFMAMQPPTSTHQEKKVMIRNGKPIFYEPDEVRDARAKLRANLSKHIPDRYLLGPLRLKVKWMWEREYGNRNVEFEYRTTKPDTDNLNKMLKDVMTDLKFWPDDAYVCVEQIEKYWVNPEHHPPGIYIEIEEITKW